MSFAVAAAGVLLCLGALAGCAFTLFAARAVGAYRPRPASAPRALPSVALFKPLHGPEPGLGANLRSFLQQDYGGVSRVWMGLHRADDGARGVAEALVAQAPDRAALVIDGRMRGANAKVSNLLNISEAAAPAEVVVLSDSDIRAPRDYLLRITAALEAPGVGVVTCLYHGQAARSGVWPGLAAMGVSYGFLPLAAVGVVAGARPCMGSTIALTAETLARIGGLERVKDVLADDYELGRAVRELHLEVVSPPFLLAHGCADADLFEMWRHEMRWSKTTQRLDPAGHAGSVIAHPAPLAALGAVLLSAAAPAMAPPALAILFAALASRLWLKARVDGAVGVATGPWWLLPIRDMLSFAVFVSAYLTARVDWRGSRFHVGRGGELTPV